MPPRVLIVDDEPRFRALYAELLEGMGLLVTQAANTDEALRGIASERPQMVLSDVRMPGASGLDLLRDARASGFGGPFLLVTAFADVRDAVTALKLGAVDYLAKPVDLDELTACVSHALGLEDDESPTEMPPPEALEGIVCASAESKRLMADLWLVAPSDASVLLTGESGTGKDVLAQFLHRNSPRRDGPFVAVNCAALPPQLLASELFGHEKGAFTGATGARPGRLREAHGGVLFLDEIGDMPLELQPVLLRALETRTITPVGATGERRVDFRLIAATHHPLRERVEAGAFRADLYYRLNVIAFEVPALRARRDDILPLARAFLASDPGPTKRISRAAATALERYPWPGNARELRNAMDRARLLQRGDVVMPEVLPQPIRNAPPVSPPPMPAAPLTTLHEQEVEAVKRALEATGGNRTRAAELLGITRRGLLKKLKRLGL